VTTTETTLSDTQEAERVADASCPACDAPGPHAATRVDTRGHLVRICCRACGAEHEVFLV
jgi:RNase P subunit RPR2